MSLRLATLLAGQQPDKQDPRERAALFGALDRAARSGPANAALLHSVDAALSKIPTLRFVPAALLRDETADVLAGVAVDCLQRGDVPASPTDPQHGALERVLLLLAFWTSSRAAPLPSSFRQLQDAAAGAAEGRAPALQAALAVLLAAFSASPAAANEEREAAWIQAARLVRAGAPPGVDPQSWRATARNCCRTSQPVGSNPLTNLSLRSAGCTAAARRSSPRAASSLRAPARSRASGPPVR